MAKTRADRNCTVCGDHYLYCRCAEYAHLEPWHDAYCSANCKDLYNITAGWINGWLDKEVELGRLNAADLSKVDRFPQWMQDTIKEMKEYKTDVDLDVLTEVIADDKAVEEAPKPETKANNNYKKVKPKYNNNKQ